MSLPLISLLKTGSKPPDTPTPVITQTRCDLTRTRVVILLVVVIGVTATVSAMSLCPSATETDVATVKRSTGRHAFAGVQDTGRKRRPSHAANLSPL